MMKERERRDKEEEEWIKEAKQTKEKERDKLSGPPPLLLLPRITEYRRKLVVKFL